MGTGRRPFGKAVMAVVADLAAPKIETRGGFVVVGRED